MAIFFGSIMVILLYLFCNSKHWFYTINYRFFLFSTFLIILRLLFPFESSYAITVPQKNFLPIIYDFLLQKLFTINDYSIYLYQIFFFIWLGGSICFLIKFVKNYVGFTKIIKILLKTNVPNQNHIKLDSFNFLEPAIYCNLTIVQTKYISTPAITGIFKPIVILPELDLTSTNFKYIILHEIQHFKFHDIFLKICLELLCVLYWWNPIVFLLKQQILNLLELRIDTVLSQNWSLELPFTMLRT